MVKKMNVTDRRLALRDSLIAVAEQTIAARGLAGLKARDLALEAGCALGAIYNVFDDLDELMLVVNSRTLAALEQALADAVRGDGAKSVRSVAVRSLVTMATAYLDFAAANTARWRALFDHRLVVGKSLPDWYLADQAKLFGYVERPLRALRPAMKAGERVLLARSLFSAVHGVVSLGLEEKLGVVPLTTLRAQVALVVAATARGLAD
jgi:AcrR family transcriptional regulator